MTNATTVTIEKDREGWGGYLDGERFIWGAPTMGEAATAVERNAFARQLDWHFVNGTLTATTAR